VLVAAFGVTAPLKQTLLSIPFGGAAVKLMNAKYENGLDIDGEQITLTGMVVSDLRGVTFVWVKKAMCNCVVP